jgi:hypothetical protein
MIDITTALIILAVLFILFLVLRSVLKVKICALCASVSTTWVLLLAFLYMGKEVDPALIGILMGGSAVGLMYYLENKLPEKYHLFKFPFLITLILLIYLLLARDTESSRFHIDLTSLWAVFIALYFLRHKKSFKGTVKKLIECCKNW